MSESIEVSRVIPAPPERIFNAWLSAQEHGQMVGSTATYEPDGHFTAWDGYISGQTLETTPNRRIVQTWRSTEFPDGAPDSHLEVVLEDQGPGTKVTLIHTDIPDGQAQSYTQGWNEHYFDPMSSYFTSAKSRILEAGEALSEAAGEASEALEAVGKQAEEFIEEAGERAEEAVATVKTAAKSAQKKARSVARSVSKGARTAKKKAQSVGKKVKGLYAKAKKKLQARGKKKAAPKRKPAAKKKRR